MEKDLKMRIYTIKDEDGHQLNVIGNKMDVIYGTNTVMVYNEGELVGFVANALIAMSSDIEEEDNCEDCCGCDEENVSEAIYGDLEEHLSKMSDRIEGELTKMEKEDAKPKFTTLRDEVGNIFAKFQHAGDDEELSKQKSEDESIEEDEKLANIIRDFNKVIEAYDTIDTFSALGQTVDAIISKHLGYSEI